MTAPRREPPRARTMAPNATPQTIAMTRLCDQGYDANRSGVNAVSPGATSTCSIPRSTKMGQSRSSTWGAARRTGSDRLGSRRFAARPTA